MFAPVSDSAAKRPAHTNLTAGESKRQCCECSAALPKNSYSKSQWSKGSRARCKPCVGRAATGLPAGSISCPQAPDSSASQRAGKPVSLAQRTAQCQKPAAGGGAGGSTGGARGAGPSTAASAGPGTAGPGNGSLTSDEDLSDTDAAVGGRDPLLEVPEGGADAATEGTPPPPARPEHVRAAISQTRLGAAAAGASESHLQSTIYQLERQIQGLQRRVNWLTGRAVFGSSPPPPEPGSGEAVDPPRSQEGAGAGGGPHPRQGQGTKGPGPIRTCNQNRACTYCRTPVTGAPALTWPPVEFPHNTTFPDGESTGTGKDRDTHRDKKVPGNSSRTAGPVQCAACADVACAVYCCGHHMTLDRWRHAGECKTIRRKDVKRYLKAGRAMMQKVMLSTAAKYSFGLTPSSEAQVYALRTLTKTKAGRKRTGLHGNSGNSTHEEARQGPGRPQGVHSFERSPLAEYAGRTKGGCDLSLKEQEIGAAAVQKTWSTTLDPTWRVPSKPWVSFGSNTSVILNWLPPPMAGRFALLRYRVYTRPLGHAQGRDAMAPEHRAPEHRAASTQPGSDTESGAKAGRGQQALSTPAAPWRPLPDHLVHKGFNPSHIVNELDPGKRYQFRVGVVGSEPPQGQADGTPVLAACAVGAEHTDGECSVPSDAFTVGHADTSSVARSAETHAGHASFTPQELAFFATLDTPGKVQDYLDSFPLNHEAEDDTCLSAIEAVRQNHAHCIEAAMLGAYILSLHGHAPMLLDMRASSADDDHIVTPFKVNGRWGCLSKPNHAALRFRNGVYKTIRELMMSYFDEYLSKDGVRSLRAYSYPVHLDAVFGPGWHSARGSVEHIAGFMDAIPHYRLVDKCHLVGVFTTRWPT